MIELLWQHARDFFQDNLGYLDLLDIVVVTFGVYWLLLLIRGTRAVQIITGLFFLLGLSLTASILNLGTVNWLLEHFLASAVLIIVILFQNDFRRALAQMGRGFFRTDSEYQAPSVLEEIVRAAQSLSQKRVGALILLQRESNLEDQIETGTVIDAEVSKDLLVSIFWPHSPLHDGAVLIQRGRIASAGCILPLTKRADLPDGLGTRHRAALGVSEETDAVVIVVSEETSAISVVTRGELIRNLDVPKLRRVLYELLTTRRAPGGSDDKSAQLAAEGVAASALNIDAKSEASAAKNANASKEH